MAIPLAQLARNHYLSGKKRKTGNASQKRGSERNISEMLYAWQLPGAGAHGRRSFCHGFEHEAGGEFHSVVSLATRSRALTFGGDGARDMLSCFLEERLWTICGGRLCLRASGERPLKDNFGPLLFGVEIGGGRMMCAPAISTEDFLARPVTTFHFLT